METSILEGDGAVLERMAMAVSVSEIEYSFQAGSYLRRLNEHLGWERVGEELEQALRELAEMGASPRELQKAREALEHNREAFQHFLRRPIERGIEKRARPVRYGFLRDSLMGKSF